MRYLMRQCLFSWGDDFYIKTADGEDAFLVDGKVFTLGDQLSFQDLEGNELAFIRQKMFSWGPTYEVHRNGQLYATVKKELFTFFRCRFEIDVPGPDDLQAEGDFLDHEYVITRGGETAAAISKKFFSLADSYTVDIADAEDAVLLLASTVVIDMACHASGED